MFYFLFSISGTVSNTERLLLAENICLKNLCGNVKRAIRFSLVAFGLWTAGCNSSRRNVTNRFLYNTSLKQNCIPITLAVFRLTLCIYHGKRLLYLVQNDNAVDRLHAACFSARHYNNAMIINFPQSYHKLLYWFLRVKIRTSYLSLLSDE